MAELMNRMREAFKIDPTVQATDDTQRIQELQRGASGRAISGDSGPKQSDLAERIALSDSRQAATEQYDQAKLAEEDLTTRMTAQFQQFDDAKLKELETAIGRKEQMAQQSAALLGNLRRSEQQLDFNRDAAKIEQIGFTLRLNNDKYINQLNDMGTRARLDDAAVFQEELLRSVFADEIELLNSDLDFKRLLTLDNNAFLKELADMDINSASELANIQIKSQQLGSMYEGAGQVLSGGLKYASKT